MKENKEKIPLATLRARKGLSQKELADIIHVSAGLIGLYETGKRNPSYSKAILISDYFDLPLENISFVTLKKENEN